MKLKHFFLLVPLQLFYYQEKGHWYRLLADLVPREKLVAAVLGVSAVQAFCFNPLLLAQEKITLSTYYPAPFGAYKKLTTDTLDAVTITATTGNYKNLKTETIEAREIIAERITPSYDSDWVNVPLIKTETARLYYLRLNHGLETADTLVQIETQVSSKRNTEDFKKAFGYSPLDYSPAIYSLVSGFPAISFPIYSKDEDDIIITIPNMPETEEAIFVRVLMWRY